jgi:tetratricopeptide (TPR) repeat protein
MEEKLDDILKDLPKFQAKRDPEGKEFSGRLLDNIFKKGSREEIDLLCEFGALYEASSIDVVKQLPSYDFNAFETLVKRRRFIQKEADGSFHCHTMIKDFAYEKLTEKEAVNDTIGKYYEKILFQNTSLNSEIFSKIINHFKRIGIRKLKSFGRRVDEKYKIADVKSLIEDNVKDTIRNYESLLVVYPEKMAYWNELGITYRKNNQKQLAIDTFRKGLKVEPENIRVLNELGITYRKNNQKQLAIDTFRKGLKVEPENIRVLNELGITYRENNQKQLAIDTFRKGLKVEPENVQVLNELGITYRENNQFEEAIQIIEKALSINPKNKHSFLNLMQIFLFFKPDKTKAKVFYDKLNDMRPAHPSFRNSRKNYEVLIENLDSIWNLMIDEFKIYDKYCFLAIQYKAYHTVLPMLFELNKKFPGNSKIISRLGKTLSNQDICRSEEGREFLKEAIELFEREHNETQLIRHIFFYLYSLLNDDEFEILNKEIEFFKNKMEHLPYYFRFLGKYYEQLDKGEEEIIEVLEKAIELSHTDDEKKLSVSTLLNYLTNMAGDKYNMRIEQLEKNLEQKNPAANMQYCKRR